MGRGCCIALGFLLLVGWLGLTTLTSPTLTTTHS